jgi:hypothetical protein
VQRVTDTSLKDSAAATDGVLGSHPMIAEDRHPRPRPGLSLAHVAAPGRGAWLWGSAVAVLVFSTVALTNSRVLLSDSYIGLYAGRFIAQHGLPHTDALTIAGHGRMWVDQQWLAHLSSYELWRVGGYAAVGAVSALAIACSFLILTACLMRRGATPMRALTWSVVAFFVCQTNTIIRAQSLVYPLFALLLFILLEDRARARPSWRLAAIPAITALYANVHGSVLLAVVMIAVACGIRCAEELAHRKPRSVGIYALVAAFSAAGVFATPYSPAELVRYYRSVLGNPVLAQAVPEWWPATFGGVSTEFVIALGLLIGVLGFALGRGYRPDPFLLIVTAGFAFAGTTAVRYQVWFAFPMAILICDALNATVGRATGSRSKAKPHHQPSRRLLPGMLGAMALALLGLSALLSFAGQSTVRMQVWVGFAGLIAGCDALHRIARGGDMTWLRRGYPAAVIVAALAAALSLARASTGDFERLTPTKAVASAATYADAHPNARILADDVSAPPLIWMHPELAGRVAFDARLEIFGQSALQGYTDFVGATVDQWDRIIPHYDVMVISRTLNPILARKLVGRTGWRTTEADHEGLALVR